MSIYDYTVKAREGATLNLADLKGKVLLIVNTATGCGFTPQYEALEKLYEKYHDQGFEVLDFPCNQFGHQAPGDEAEIHQFCTGKYKTQFDQLAKIEVNGETAHPLYKWLYSEKPFAGFGEGETARFMDQMLSRVDAEYASNPDIKWNFTKFLIDRKGRVVARFEPVVIPEALDAEIDALL